MSALRNPCLALTEQSAVDELEARNMNSLHTIMFSASAGWMINIALLFGLFFVFAADRALRAQTLVCSNRKVEKANNGSGQSKQKRKHDEQFSSIVIECTQKLFIMPYRVPVAAECDG